MIAARTPSHALSHDPSVCREDFLSSASRFGFCHVETDGDRSCHRPDGYWRTVKEAKTGEFPSTGGLRLYRLDFFVLLRTLMYALIVPLASLSGLALADLLGAEIFD